MFLAAGAVILSAPAAAQQPATENPNALRAPTLLAFPPATRQREVVRLYFAELRRAIQAADTMTLSALVPEFVIPEAEKLNARLAGCSSLAAGVTRLRTRTTPLGGASAVRLDQVEVTPAAQGDTVAFGFAQLTADARTSDLSVALTGAGHARSMARVQGLLAALCTVPVTANGNSRVQTGPQR